MPLDVDRLARALAEFYGKDARMMRFAAEHIAALYEDRPARQIDATNPPRIVTEGGLIAMSEDAAYTARSDADHPSPIVAGVWP